MRTINFAKRNMLEILRDPLSIFFTIFLPLFLLFLFQQFQIPSENYLIHNFTPAILLFSFSFITLFTATLLAKDRNTAFLIRLGVSPMHAYEYIFGYVLAILPIIVLQNICFFALAIILGLTFSISLLYTFLLSLIIAIFFICLGLIIGSFLSEKAASSVSSVIVQLVSFTSGMYFDSSNVGSFFALLCDILPFSHMLIILRNIMNNNISNISLLNIIVTSLYIILTIFGTIIFFKKRMVCDNR